MKDLLKKLELKHADLLIYERMLRNSDTCHPLIAHNLVQVRSQINTLQIQINMIDVLLSVEQEIKKERSDTDESGQKGVGGRASGAIKPFGTQW